MISWSLRLRFTTGCPIGGIRCSSPSGFGPDRPYRPECSLPPSSRAWHPGGAGCRRGPPRPPGAVRGRLPGRPALPRCPGASDPPRPAARQPSAPLPPARPRQTAQAPPYGGVTLGDRGNPGGGLARRYGASGGCCDPRPARPHRGGVAPSAWRLIQGCFRGPALRGNRAPIRPFFLPSAAGSATKGKPAFRFPLN